MHEFGIASEIVNAAVAEAARHGGRRITGVKVRVGVLRGVVPESLRLFFEHASRETPAQDAPLEIEEEPVLVGCDSCGEVPSTTFSLACPACGREGVRVRGGDSLHLVSIEIEA